VREGLIKCILHSTLRAPAASKFIPDEIFDQMHPAFDPAGACGVKFCSRQNFQTFDTHVWLSGDAKSRW
jgi:hypothetical protein